MKKTILMFSILAILLSACGGKSAVQDENPVGGTSPASGNSSKNSSSSQSLSSALNLVLGTSDEPGVFASYHIELVLDTPQANDDNTGIVNQTVKISADVAGKNVHIFQVDPGATEAKEGYIIGDNDTEYKWVDGAWQPTMGQIALGWALWPMQVVTPYAYASALYTNKTGTEEIDGRSADVYELDTSKADPATVAGMETFGVKGLSGKGKVWIDRETGAMLKLDLDYTNELTSLDGSVDLGAGSGHVSLELSKIGQVTVTSPV